MRVVIVSMARLFYELEISVTCLYGPYGPPISGPAIKLGEEENIFEVVGKEVGTFVPIKPGPFQVFIQPLLSI